METSEVRQRLEEEKKRLLSVRQAAGELTGPGLVSATVEQASEGIEREIDEEVLLRTEAELAEVEAALQRVSAGTYGLCELCGHPIAHERLEALPAARYCIDDQSRVQREPWLRNS